MSDAEGGAVRIVLEAGTAPMLGYRLLRRLGVGGFGEVWQAESPGGFSVALKFVRLDGGASVEARSLEILKHVRHPNILTPFASWQVGDFLIIAMELADGSLWDRLREDQARGLPGIPREDLLEFMGEAAKGLDYLNAHRHDPGDGRALGIQHRDLKPQNILLCGGGVKVADFGLSRLLESSLTGHTGSLTPSYAAPEFFDQQTADQSDQYSLAVTYCVLRGGRLPFRGNPSQVMYGHINSPPDLSMIPEAERPAVARALAKRPDARWPRCREFVRALQAAGGGGDPTAPDSTAGEDTIPETVEAPDFPGVTTLDSVLPPPIRVAVAKKPRKTYHHTKISWKFILVSVLALALLPFFIMGGVLKLVACLAGILLVLWLALLVRDSVS